MRRPRVNCNVLWTKSLVVAVAVVLAGTAMGGGSLARSDEVADEPSHFEPPIALADENGIIDTGDARGHAGPCLEDVDGDGLRDLVVGDFSGTFRVYRNIGSESEPRYAAPVRLQAGGETANVPIY